MFTGSQSKIVARDGSGFKERERTLSTRVGSKSSEQSAEFGCTDSELTCQSTNSCDRRKSFLEAVFTSLVCGDTSADLHYDTPDETDVLHTSQTAAPLCIHKEVMFKNLVCGDTSADLHYDTPADFEGVPWPGACLAGKGFEKGAFSKRNLVYDDTSADLHLGDEEPTDMWTEESSVLQIAPQTADPCITSKEAIFAGLACGDTSADLHYDTPAEFDRDFRAWARLAGKGLYGGAFSKRNLIYDDTSADLHLGGEEPMDVLTDASIHRIASETVAPRISKEILFKSLVCDDTSADLHYDTLAECEGVLWLWASLADKGFKEGAFSKRNLVYDDTSVDLHLGDEGPDGILIDASVLWIKQLSGQSDFDCKLSSGLHIG